nr:pumilio likey domain family member 6 [Quercus suber]
MGGIKRKEAPSKAKPDVKKQRIESKHSKKSRLDQAADDDGDDSGAFSGEEEPTTKPAQTNGFNKSNGNDRKDFKLETSSAEAHAKQRALVKERKAAKPNADVIGRSKKIWERLRRKSHVPKEERKELVTELFSIINGRVRDFVFKHDSVRVIQCALKYANQEQRKIIVEELKSDIRPLAESRYGKFLVAKMVVEGDQHVRDTIIPEFYGHVKRLINHPEASWIVDDIYRQIANPQQKVAMLREWYGPEFALFRGKDGAENTADLVDILKENPEKRKPVLQHLHQMCNSMVQKKMTGFTMLHDAMLQYFLALDPVSEEHKEFLETLKGDIDAETEGGGGDLYRNLAFTKSGSRLVCLALAYGSAKDRKIILKTFKDNIELMAFDQYAKLVLVTGLEVPDDTKLTTKGILHEVLGQSIDDETQRLDRLETLVVDLNARLTLLYPLAGSAKWLVNDHDKTIMDEVLEIRKETSKKAPEVRRQALVEFSSVPLLELVTKRIDSLIKSSFGCQFISEVLLDAIGDRIEAKSAVAKIAVGDPTSDEHVSKNAAVGRMLKTLVLGGNFDPATKATKLVEPRLEFAEVLFPIVKDHLVDWACSDSSFVVVALLETDDAPAARKTELRNILIKGKKRIEAAAKGAGKKAGGKETKDKGNAGARILLEKLNSA